MKTVILGAAGQLGREICRQIGASAIGLDRDHCDITNRLQVLAVLKSHRPDAVINAAAYTNVDRAERETEACLAVNALAVEHLAEACRDLDCKLVQISTDYVFGQDAQRSTPYRESDPPGPLGVYGQSKWLGERAAAKWTKHLIVRTCGLYGPRGKPTQSNFVDTMLRLVRERDVLRVVDDQRCTPSYVADIAQAIMFLVGSDAYGTYHVVNSGATTWHDFAAEIFRIAGIPVRLERISTAEYGVPAPRPASSVLDTSKYHALGGPTMRPWQDALAAYLQTSGGPSQ